MSERTLILAFCAGLLPGAAFTFCVLALVRSWCMAVKSERDALKQVRAELESRYAAVAAESSEITLMRRISPTSMREQPLSAPGPEEVEPARAQAEKDFARLLAEKRGLEEALARQTEHTTSIERELAQVRHEHMNLQAALAREKKRIGRAVADLKQIREAWLNNRRLLGETPADRSARHSGRPNAPEPTSMGHRFP